MNGVSGGAVRELPTQGGLRYFTGAQSLLRPHEAGGRRPAEWSELVPLGMHPG